MCGLKQPKSSLQLLNDGLCFLSFLAKPLHKLELLTINLWTNVWLPASVLCKFRFVWFFLFHLCPGGTSSDKYDCSNLPKCICHDSLSVWTEIVHNHIPSGAQHSSEHDGPHNPLLNNCFLSRPSCRGWSRWTGQSECFRTGGQRCHNAHSDDCHKAQSFREFLRKRKSRHASPPAAAGGESRLCHPIRCRLVLLQHLFVHAKKYYDLLFIFVPIYKMLSTRASSFTITRFISDSEMTCNRRGKIIFLFVW